MNKQAGRINVRMTVRNTHSVERILFLEPWAIEFKMPPGDVLEIRIEDGDPEYPLETELTNEGITVTVFDNAGVVARVYRDGKPVDGWED